MVSKEDEMEKAKILINVMQQYIISGIDDQKIINNLILTLRSFKRLDVERVIKALYYRDVNKAKEELIRVLRS
ncbi:hypothetical protein YN1551_2383 [Sulfolobus islandicus Y.N.15.51]|jgi:isochorismate hydrolase|uniref:Uncharacterized protein n=3 Tax=Saccharolobus islandicus TaxID=43080 RepID=C3MXA9_SACI4|nr:hypothetical protein [Sulfolobus islandicus]ACP37789.1 hypothetical protein M1425_1022 [Sulfolobus islandicus M.14.25]ACP49354.1 hypothetical protein YN1551_2383 [Sulfolobus islandicus Y.N.15.51]ACP54983.1 hypothetical protein M1627_1085 [Sulfolobus islandicus M.16.27]